jgi:hypothetical protein
MLKSKCKASLRQHSKAKVLNLQRRWPIKTAEHSRWEFAGAERVADAFDRLRPLRAATRPLRYTMMNARRFEVARGHFISSAAIGHRLDEPEQGRDPPSSRR